MADGEPYKSPSQRDQDRYKRSGIHVSQRGCAICHEKYSVGSILRPNFTVHVQGVGDAVYEGRYKGRAVELHVCMPCYYEQKNLIFKEAARYHSEGEA